jgi:hypothetical protein
MAYDKTVYSLNDVHVQVILPKDFKIICVDSRKRSLQYQNYANAGYFALLKDGSTLPTGNLVINGDVVTSADSQPNWLNTYKHILSTIVIDHHDTPKFVQTSKIEKDEFKYAISGIPIIHNGYRVSMDSIRQEGYFGNECYQTWHSFLGIRGKKLVYVAANIGFNQMVYLLEVLGIENGIKLDGGGSFICKSGKDWQIATSENRRINNIITW